MYGSSQGVTDGSAKWVLNDKVISKTYNKKATGCVMHDPTQEIKKHQNSARFVNDVTLLHNAERFDTEAMCIMNLIQTDVNLHGSSMSGENQALKMKMNFQKTT
eukprot:7288475-Ditylum_brightwellii.AAC.1